MIKRELIEDFFGRERRFNGIERELKVPMPGRKIISIIGPRRCGKTTYFYYLIDRVLKEGMYIDFEDIAFKKMTIEEFFEVIKIYNELKPSTKFMLLDEVQSLNGWETLVRSLFDRGYRIFITGSSSKLTSREIATQLRGRSLKFLLLTFSFREFLKAKKIKLKLHTFEERGRLLGKLREYLEFGGFPEVVLSEEKEKILKSYADEVFYKDFVERHKIKSLDFGRFLFEFTFQNFSNELSIKRIKKFFGKNISERTLYKYTSYLEDTLFIFFLRKFSKSVYLRTSWPRKVYICDTGITKIVRFSPDYGKLMENTVFLELLRKTNEKPLLQIFYFKDYQQHEVDFVVKEGLKVKQLIQVTYASSLDEIEKRELRSLIKASELLKCKDLLVITWDLEDEMEFKGKKIRFMPLWKWLLKI